MSSHSLDYERSLSLDPDFMDENRKSAIVLSDLDSIAVPSIFLFHVGVNIL